MFGRAPFATLPFCVVPQGQLIDAYQRLRARDLSESFVAVRDRSDNYIEARDKSEGDP